MMAAESLTAHTRKRTVEADLPSISPIHKMDKSGLPPHSLAVMMRSYRLPSSMQLPYSTDKISFKLSDSSLKSFVPSSRISHLYRMHEKFAEELQLSLTRQVSFTSKDIEKEELSTSQHVEHCNDPPPKRRRFQRRNSKTPAMMLSTLSDLCASDLEGDSFHSHTSSEGSISHNSDSGLEIAEELVRQLQLRREAIESNFT
jgi:hypothetical protein